MGRSCRAAFLSAVAALGVAVGGCVSIAHTETGSAPPPEAVAGVREGEPIEDVVARLGVPLQTVDQANGKLIVYRKRDYVFRRLGFEPGVALRFVDVTGLVSSFIANVKLVLEWSDVDERRLVVLFDEEERVQAIAYRPGDDE